MKKILFSILLAFCLVTATFSLVACKNGEGTSSSNFSSSIEDNNEEENNDEEKASELAYSLNSTDDGYVVTGIGLCTDTDIVIPATYKNLPVTAIKYGAFANQSTLKSIVIPNSVTSMEANIFAGCENLEKITLPFLGDGAEETHLGYIFVNGCEGYSDNEYVPQSLRSVVINGNKSIGNWAFYGCGNLTSIILADGITAIGRYVFGDCVGLTSIVIPDSVISIGEDLFEDCSNLENVVIGNGVEALYEHTFYNCAKLTNVTIGNSVSYISGEAFYNCTGLKSIVIPNSVTAISEGAFCRCSGLEEMTLPFVGSQEDKLSADRASLFGWIFGTTKYLDAQEVKQYYSSVYSGCTYYIPPNLRSVKITGGTIFYGSFGNCASLTKVIIGEGVSEVEEYVFTGCNNLTIYCEAASKPSDWASYWNNEGRPVVWGYTGS